MTRLDPFGNLPPWFTEELVCGFHVVVVQLSIESKPWGLTIAVLTVRNVPEEMHRGLRTLAATHHRSTEAEIRSIPESAAKTAQGVRLGDRLGEISRNVGLTNEDFAVLEKVSDKSLPSR